MTDAELQALENLGHGDAAEEIRELRANFAALQHAIVGDTGASAILTAERLRAELAASREREARMRALLQAADVLFAHHCRDCTAQNWLDDTRAALAEGAQG
jgi:hypothetical protein